MERKRIEFEENKDSHKFMYVLFKDKWCSKCKDVEYIIKEIGDVGIPVYFINISDNVDLISKYSIEEVPTVIVFKRGRIFDFIVGKRPKDRYWKFVHI